MVIPRSPTNHRTPVRRIKSPGVPNREKVESIKMLKNKRLDVTNDILGRWMAGFKGRGGGF